jgi:hypothetical protein
MTISGTRGNFSRLVSRFIFVLPREFSLPIRSCGDTTCDRQDLDRGVEPDECFCIVHEPVIRAREDIDLTVDPPADRPP